MMISDSYLFMDISLDVPKEVKYHHDDDIFSGKEDNLVLKGEESIARFLEARL